MAKDPKDQKAPDAPEIKTTDAPVTDNPERAAATEKETKPAAEEAKAAPRQTIKVLYVVSRRAEGFRRAGFAFGSERTRLVVDDLTAKQVKQLKEEPMLVVTEATEEV
jgi:hypothetical protein